MKKLLVCLLAGLSAILLVALMELLRARRDRALAGDAYHEMARHWQSGGGWHHDWHRLKDAMDRENSVGGEKSPRSHAAAAWKQMLEDEEAEGWRLPNSDEEINEIKGGGTSAAADSKTQQEEAVVANEHEKTNEDEEAGKEEGEETEAEKDEEEKEQAGDKEEESEDMDHGEEEVEALVTVAEGPLSPHNTMSESKATKDGSKDPHKQQGAPLKSQHGGQQHSPRFKQTHNLSISKERMAAHRSEARKASPKLMGVEDGPGHKESGEGALESPAKQEKAAAAQRKPKTPSRRPDPDSRAAVVLGLRRLDPVRLEVAAIMGSSLRLPGVSAALSSTLRPCFGRSGKAKVCSARRSSTPRRPSPRKDGESKGARDDLSANTAPAEDADEGDWAPPTGSSKLKPGDQGYHGVNMYVYEFFGSFAMNKDKYSRYSTNEALRIAKYKSQCALNHWDAPDKPPRGCDTSAATGDPPRSRGWDRVGRINDRFLELLPDVDPFKAMPKFKSCAVVGNGGSLLLNEMGHAIDGHEAVIRFNGGVTRGFEQWVGSHTTIRILNTQHIGFHEFDDEILLQHATSMATMEEVLIYKIRHPDLRMYITDGDFHQYVLDEMGDGAASNGFYGVIFSNQLCEKVTLFGFYKSWGAEGLPNGGAADNAGARVKYHYYDKVEPNGSQKSRDDKETPALIAFLRKHQNKFLFGEPTAVGALVDTRR